MPWFQSTECVREEAYVMPDTNDWRPLLPARELQVPEASNEFTLALADPEYNISKETHIILGVGFVARIMNYKIGSNEDGTVLLNTTFGNVVMGEHRQNWEELDESLASTGTIVNDELNEKLNEMVERLWKIDCIGTETVRTKEQEWWKIIFLKRIVETALVVLL